MAHVNENYLKLPGNYLFATIAKKVAAYSKAHPDADIIRLGIGDVTRPLAPAIIEAMHKAVDEMGKAETFRGYGPEQGYDFLRQAIIDGDYKTRGIDLELDEVFIGDGSKTDAACIQEIFGSDLTFAVADPVYPVYLDSNVMCGHTGLLQCQHGPLCRRRLSALHAGKRLQSPAADRKRRYGLPLQPVQPDRYGHEQGRTGKLGPRRQRKQFRHHLRFGL
jgi:hypothetical protein